jgi:hypothetical protein
MPAFTTVAADDGAVSQLSAASGAVTACKDGNSSVPWVGVVQGKMASTFV